MAIPRDTCYNITKTFVALLLGEKMVLFTDFSVFKKLEVRKCCISIKIYILMNWKSFLSSVFSVIQAEQEPDMVDVL